MTTIVYSWEFPKFNVYNTLDGLTQVVYNIEWILNATDGQGHGDMLRGSVDLGQPDPSTFVPYRLLTKDQVEVWVQSALGSQLDELKGFLERKIESYRAPTTASLRPPY